MGSWGRFNSGDRTRTCDPLVNSQLLYQLSYAGKAPHPVTGSGTKIEID